MKKNKLIQIEETYLQIFKIVIIVLLTITLLASVIFVLKGLSEMMATPDKAEAAKDPGKPNVSIEKFLNQYDDLDKPKPPEPSEPKEEAPKTVPKDISLDDMTDAYLAKLWTYYDGYQKKCNAPVQVDKETFLRTFPRQVLRSWIAAYGKEFAESQDAFEKNLLSNKRAIEVCIKKEGKAGIFNRSLDWHVFEWRMELNRIDKFRRDEERRVTQFERSEYLRVAAKKMNATSTLLMAAYAFCVFLSLAMLLIFAKIESNLRGVRVIEKEVD
jgi:hypothetical protein